MNYDRYYDMIFGPTPQGCPVSVPGPTTITIHTTRLDESMRGTGVEPVSLSAPDPKSHTAPENLTRGAGSAVTTAAQRRTAPESAAPTTTVTTTRALGLPLYVADPFTAQPARVGGVE